MGKLKDLISLNHVLSGCRGLSVSCLLAASNAFAAGPADTWGVLVPGLPARVSTADEDNNVSFYILKQTHEPVFRRPDGENYSSRILSNWSRSLDYKLFSFCLKPGLYFGPGNPYRVENFAAHVSSLTVGFDSEARVKSDSRCVYVEFPHARKDFLYFWTQYRNAPTRVSGAAVEIGLGQFSVRSLSKEKIELESKTSVGGGYSRIVLSEFQGEDDPRLRSEETKDFNLINSEMVPDWVKESFLSFDNPEMKSVILVINHPDPAVRARIYGCVDIAGLREAYFPGKTDFYDIATVLPLGVPGAEAGLPVRRCAKSGMSGDLRMANWMKGNDAQMKSFVERFERESGLRLKLERYSAGEFAAAYSRSPKPFELSVILVYVSYSPKDFFKMFFTRGELYDFDLGRFSGGYAKVVGSAGEARSEDAYAELAGLIARNALALPLYQSKRKLYYPKEIKNLTVGRGILEYPEVAEFKR